MRKTCAITKIKIEKYLEWYFSEQTNETWIKTHLSPLYEVSNLGRLRTYTKARKKPRLMKPNCNTADNRPKVGITAGGKRHQCFIHRLVLVAFSNSEPKGKQVAHNDGNKYNNRLENLRWATHMENVMDRYKHGTIVYINGESHGLSKLTSEQVLEIRKSKLNNRAIAKIYNLAESNIRAIRSRKTWKHI